MNRDDVMEILKSRDVIVKHVEHEPLFTMEDAKVINEDGSVANNLVLKDKKNYYFLSLKGNNRLSIKDIQLVLNSKALSFAKENDLDRLLKLGKGEVTPLGLLNDKKHEANYYIDIRFKDKVIGVHPLTNTETVWLKTEDLEKLLEEYGVSVKYALFDKILG